MPSLKIARISHYSRRRPPLKNRHPRIDVGHILDLQYITAAAAAHDVAELRRRSICLSKLNWMHNSCDLKKSWGQMSI